MVSKFLEKKNKIHEPTNNASTFKRCKENIFFTNYLTLSNENTYVVYRPIKI